MVHLLNVRQMAVDAIDEFPSECWPTLRNMIKGCDGLFNLMSEMATEYGKLHRYYTERDA